MTTAPECTVAAIDRAHHSDRRHHLAPNRRAALVAADLAKQAFIAFVDYRDATDPRRGRRRGQSPLRGAAAWPQHIPALDYARTQLARHRQNHAAECLPAADPLAERRMLQLLEAVLAADSVYPTMFVDEDGAVVAEWRLLDYGIEFTTEPDGTSGYVLRHKGIRRGSGGSITTLRKLLRDVSAIVAEANPNWRSLFPQGRTYAR